MVYQTIKINSRVALLPKQLRLTIYTQIAKIGDYIVDIDTNTYQVTSTGWRKIQVPIETLR